MGQGKGQNQWKSHELFYFDDVIHKNAGLYKNASKLIQA